jgi:16S rRNA (guanine966-N2)-methyltransferase
MKNNLLRIIGGEWRSRKLRFADVPGLRPTPDRVRETLFNWLQMQVPGARCLDLFAGSGALGLEALSRGAREVVMVEKHPAAARALRDNIALLGAQNAVLVNDDAFRYLRSLSTAEAFDLIFLDPPFRKNLLEPVLDIVFAKALLNSGGMIYLEQETGAATDFSRFNLQVHRETQAGQVQSLLLI